MCAFAKAPRKISSTKSSLIELIFSSPISLFSLHAYSRRHVLINVMGGNEEGYCSTRARALHVVIIPKMHL